tara:strand:+ start:671 stop:1039 length:369 start_codon:yes stop_codon:yes gene_type:complete
MASIGVALPLTKNDIDGFTMLKKVADAAKQNLKMLLLTIPGERVMDSDYGVGLKKYLFNNFTQETYSEIDSKIRQQIAIYMPAIQISEIRFSDSEQDTNKLAVSISYYLPGISVSDLLQFTI